MGAVHARRARRRCARACRSCRRRPAPVPGWRRTGADVRRGGLVDPGADVSRRRVLAIVARARPAARGGVGVGQLDARVRAGATDGEDPFTFGHLFSQRAARRAARGRGRRRGRGVAGAAARVRPAALRLALRPPARAPGGGRHGAPGARGGVRTRARRTTRGSGAADRRRQGGALHARARPGHRGRRASTCPTRAGSCASGSTWSSSRSSASSRRSAARPATCSRPRSAPRFEHSEAFGELRACIDPARWREVWELRRIQFRARSRAPGRCRR